MEVVFWFLLAGGIGAIAVYRPAMIRGAHK